MPSKFVPVSEVSKEPRPQAVRANVLYVEDEDANWDIAAHSLRSAYSLIRAKTSQEAVDALERHDVSLILMDIQLAGSELNGIELAQTLKGKRLATGSAARLNLSKWKSIPIVFVTANRSGFSAQQVEEYCGDELITKPVDLVRLRMVMTRVMLKPHLK